MAKVTEVAKTKEKKPKASYPVSVSGILWKIGVLGLVDAIVFFMIMVMLTMLTVDMMTWINHKIPYKYSFTNLPLQKKGLSPLII